MDKDFTGSSGLSPSYMMSLMFMLVVFALLLPSALALSFKNAASQPPLPNIVLIMADDSGWGDLGSNWPATLDTPFLSAFANRSLRLTDYHSGASVCSPSRAALLTGRYGVRTGVTANFAQRSVGGLTVNETILAEYLKSVGYSTAIHGKWHLGHNKPFHPSYRGFDEYFGVPYSIDMGCVDVPGANLPPDVPCPRDNQTRPDPLYEQPGMTPDQNQTVVALPLYQCLSPHCDGGDCNRDIIEQPLNLSALTDNYIAQDISFIDRMTAKKKPFLLYMPLSHMHVPHATAPRFTNTSKARTIYGDTLLELDTHLRTLYEHIEQLGIMDNTIIIYTSDNGPWAAECELAGSLGPFLGLYQQTVGGGGSVAKFTTWEGGHRVPSLVHWRGHIQPRVSNALTSSLDWIPTFSRLTGYTLPSDRSFDGIDLSPILFNGSNNGHTTLFHPDPIGNLTAMRFGRYKVFFRTFSLPGCGGIVGADTQHNPPIIFDLSKDIAESTPVEVSVDVMQMIVIEYYKKLDDIANTPQSMPDYRIGTDADRACCDSAHIVCRCQG